MAKLLFSYILFMYISLSQECCMPKQMEANQEIFQFTRTIDAGNIISYMHGSLSYDILNQRMATITSTSDGLVETGKYKTIQFFSNHTMYGVTDSGCLRINIPAQMPTETCVPPIARKVGNCSPIQGQHSTDKYVLSLQGITQEYHTDKNCVIYEQYSTGIINGASVDISMTLSNVTLGISDPSMFVLPSTCYNATEQSVDLTQYAQLASNFGRRSMDLIKLQ